jgi:hypothetical protein
MSAVDHVGFEEFKVGDIGILALKLAHGLNFLILAEDEGSVGVAFTVDEGQHSEAILPAVLTGQPTGRLGQQHHAEEEEDGGNHLQTPGNTEGGSARDIARSVGNAVLVRTIRE